MKNKTVISDLYKLNFNNLIKLFHNDPTLFYQYMKTLIIGYKKIFHNNISGLTITNFYFFVPQSYKLKIEDIECCQNNNNLYIFNDYPIKKIICGNYILPHYSLCSIPFTFAYTVNNNCVLRLSNVYYYEVTIGDYDIPKYNRGCISIGYGSKNNNLNNRHVGWDRNSVGIHSDDGKYFFNSFKGKPYRISFDVNDTIGAGLIYIERDKYIPFFTRNGNLFPQLDPVILNGFIVPQIGYEHFTSIKVNFGSINFKFRLKKIIDKYNNIISTKNNFIHQSYNIKNFEFNIKYHSKISKLIQPPKIIIKNKSGLIKNAKKKYIKLLKVHDKYEPSENINSSDEDNNYKSINIIGKKISLSPVNNQTENISNWAQNNTNYNINLPSPISIPTNNVPSLLNNYQNNPFYNFEINPSNTSISQNILSYSTNQLYNNNFTESSQYLNNNQNSLHGLILEAPPPPYSHDIESASTSFSTTDIVNNVFEAVQNQLDAELNAELNMSESDSAEEISDD
jgi:hypothetical protein